MQFFDQIVMGEITHGNLEQKLSKLNASNFYSIYFDGGITAAFYRYGHLNDTSTTACIISKAEEGS